MNLDLIKQQEDLKAERNSLLDKKNTLLSEQVNKILTESFAEVKAYFESAGFEVSEKSNTITAKYKEASFTVESKKSTKPSVFAEISFSNSNNKKPIIISLVDNRATPKEKSQSKFKDRVTDIEKLKNDIAELQDFISNFGNLRFYFSIPVDNIRTAHYILLIDAIKSIK